MVPWDPVPVAAKRSPILGYNHNVRFRGIVFHIQTEDSGVGNPHVFSHLFHGGVILSTRKLVYDAGANEDAVKSLMQAQHKAVMKDLRRGAFDDKIDSYLAGTPGLLPREAANPAPEAVLGDPTRPVEATPVEVAPPAEAAPPVEAAPNAPPAPAAAPPPIAPPADAAPIAHPPIAPPAPAAAHPPIAPPAPAAAHPHPSIAHPAPAAVPRKPPTHPPPPASVLAPATLVDRRVPAPTEPPAVIISHPVEPLVAAPPPAPFIEDEPSGPVIELIEPFAHTSAVTEPVIPTISYGASDEPSIELVAAKPAAFLVEDDDLLDAPASNEAVGRAPTQRSGDPRSHPVVAPPPPDDEPPPRTRTDISAALQAIQVPDDDLPDDAPAQIHSPALPSAPQPPGASPERVGEYHVTPRRSTVIESPAPPARPPIPRPTPVSSRIPTPSNTRSPVPQRPPTTPPVKPPSRPPAARVAPPPPPPGRAPFRPPSAPPPPRAATPPAPPAPPAPIARPTPSAGIPQIARPTPQQTIPRVGTPSTRPPFSDTTQPGRAPVAPPRRPASGGGVVVSRPAVIVGGKPGAGTPPAKVRRAKDAESFGGDLISERSLDEVILAYLSEDNNED